MSISEPEFFTQILTVQQQHIIHSLSYDVQFDEHAKNDQLDQLSKLHYHKLVRIIEKVFDQISRPDEYLQINRLELDLPKINKENWTKELAYNLENALSDKMESFLLSARKAMENKGHDNSDIHLLSQEEKEQENFLYFLKTGMFNWTNTQSKQTVNEIFKTAFRGDSEQLNKGLQKLLRKSKSALSRFIYQLNSDLQIDWLKSSFPGREEMISQLLHLVESLGENRELPDSLSRRMSFWIKTRFYSFLFTSDKNGTSAESFINSISSEFSSRFFIDISIPKGTSQKLSLTSYGKEFDRSEDLDPLDDRDAEITMDKSHMAVNAGLILAWPYLHNLFQRLGLLRDHVFKGENERIMAVYILHYLATGEDEVEEHKLLVPKILTGMQFRESLPLSLELNPYLRAECNLVLESMIKNWPALKSTSPKGLRVSFLQRQALIKNEDAEWHFYFERKGIDVLLERLPYSISLLKFKWLNQLIYTTW